MRFLKALVTCLCLFGAASVAAQADAPQVTGSYSLSSAGSYFVSLSGQSQCILSVTSLSGTFNVSGSLDGATGAGTMPVVNVTTGVTLVAPYSSVGNYAINVAGYPYLRIVYLTGSAFAFTYSCNSGVGSVSAISPGAATQAGGSTTIQLTSATAATCTTAVASPSRLVGITNASTTAQTAVLTIYNESTATCALADQIYQITLGASQIATLPNGGIYLSSGLTYLLSTTLTNPIIIQRY